MREASLGITLTTGFVSGEGMGGSAGLVLNAVDSVGDLISLGSGSSGVVSLTGGNDEVFEDPRHDCELEGELVVYRVSPGSTGRFCNKWFRIRGPRGSGGPSRSRKGSRAESVVGSMAESCRGSWSPEFEIFIDLHKDGNAYERSKGGTKKSLYERLVSPIIHKLWQWQLSARSNFPPQFRRFVSTRRFLYVSQEKMKKRKMEASQKRE